MLMENSGKLGKFAGKAFTTPSTSQCSQFSKKRWKNLRDSLSHYFYKFNENIFNFQQDSKYIFETTFVLFVHEF